MEPASSPNGRLPAVLLGALIAVLFASVSPAEGADQTYVFRTYNVAKPDYDGYTDVTAPAGREWAGRRSTMFSLISSAGSDASAPDVVALQELSQTFVHTATTGNDPQPRYSDDVFANVSGLTTVFTSAEINAQQSSYTTLGRAAHILYRPSRFTVYTKGTFRGDELVTKADLNGSTASQYLTYVGSSGGDKLVPWVRLQITGTRGGYANEQILVSSLHEPCNGCFNGTPAASAQGNDYYRGLIATGLRKYLTNKSNAGAGTDYLYLQVPVVIMGDFNTYYKANANFAAGSPVGTVTSVTATNRLANNGYGDTLAIKSGHKQTQNYACNSLPGWLESQYTLFANCSKYDYIFTHYDGGDTTVVDSTTTADPDKHSDHRRYTAEMKFKQ